MNRVAGKTAMVTGAAKGLGAATAKMLASHGARVLVSDLDEANGNAVVAQIKGAGGDARFTPLDTTDEQGWDRAIADCLDAFGTLNILVNNAGICTTGSVEDVTLAEWRRILSVNLDGVFLGTQRAIRVMKRNDALNSIINLSSIMGVVAEPMVAAYCASKAGVRNFTKSAALYCASQGYKIRVNSVHPGYVATPLLTTYLSALGDVEELSNGVAAMHPMGHLGEPDDIAYGILYLASDESKFMTGSELAIDGGYLAQ